MLTGYFPVVSSTPLDDLFQLVQLGSPGFQAFASGFLRARGLKALETRFLSGKLGLAILLLEFFCYRSSLQGLSCLDSGSSFSIHICQSLCLFQGKHRRGKKKG
jgi:hypothetical protein